MEQDKFDRISNLILKMVDINGPISYHHLSDILSINNHIDKNDILYVTENLIENDEMVSVVYILKDDILEDVVGEILFPKNTKIVNYVKRSN